MSSALPQPTRARWQPLRLGLVEFFYYDSEEFWFADGHLLLRGNNGTGKSKILSLTLPFLLDANLSASRVEPDGDRSKRMEWNLLVGKHEQRTGYAWIEFGRVDEVGEAQFFTLGCGIKAVKDRTRTDHWFFNTSQRIGQDLRLISESRVVLGKEALTLALGHHGRIATSGQEHRKEVDEKLFQLGPDRYAALIDTLIQLRQPQLSKKPDEQPLSTALSNALPPLSQALLDGVAESLNQLDQGREELQGIEQLRDAVAKFNQTYRRYAQVLARRQAKVLRQAQTAHENAGAAWDAAKKSESDAKLAKEAAHQAVENAESQLRRDRAALEILNNDPEAKSFADAQQKASEATKEAETTASRATQAKKQWEDEQLSTQARERACAQKSSAQVQRAGELKLQAVLAGIAEPPAEWLRFEAQADALRRDTRQRADQRREHVRKLRGTLKIRQSAQAERDKAKIAADHSKAITASAEERANDTHKGLQAASAALLQGWRTFMAQLVELKLPEPEAAQAELELWVESLAEANPAQQAFDAVKQHWQQRIAGQEAEAQEALRQLDQREAPLAEEEGRLQSGLPPEPPALLTRDVSSRHNRAGAPLWQLIEFRESVPAAARAGLESALQAAGLLDAWLLPDGELLADDIHDASLLARQPRARNLADWLCAAEQNVVPASVIEAILTSIACESPDDAAEAWISTAGRYRLGPLAGQWVKPQAEFIGHAAREAARQQRLADIAVLRAAIVAERKVQNDLLQALLARRKLAQQERDKLPSDEALRSAHATRNAAKQAFEAAAAQQVKADTALLEAQGKFDAASKVLAEEARDLHLPQTEDALREVEAAINQFQQAGSDLAAALQGWQEALANLTEQQAREAAALQSKDSAAEQAQQKQSLAESAQAAFNTLQSVIGSKIETIKQRISELNAAVTQGDMQLPTLRKHAVSLERAHSVSEEKMQARAHDVAVAEEARRSAAETLQRFAETELLAVADSELELPTSWTVDASLQLARKTEQSLSAVEASDEIFARLQKEISSDYTELGRALTAQGQQAAMEQNDFGLTVRVFHANRPERPDVLEQRLTAEATQRLEILSSQERAVLENHLQSHIAVDLQTLMKQAEAQKTRINKELEKRPTSTGVRFKLDWEPLPAAHEGAEGFEPLRKTLLLKSKDAWSPTESAAIGSFLQARINSQRATDGTGKLADHLAAALDYRCWHRYRVSRSQGAEWKPLAGGAASSGEKALGVTVPMFAAASGHYASCGNPHAPRLVLLDEAFAGIDDEARSHCMGLIKAFDLDFVMTSEREWGCHPTLPGVAIAQLQRLPNVDAVHVSRWRWDGLSKRPDVEPPRSP